MPAQQVTIKPVKIRPPRGKAGRFVSKAIITGTRKISRFFPTLKDNALTLARREVRGVMEAGVEEVKARVQGQNVERMGGTKFGQPRRFDTPLHPFTVKEKDRKGLDDRTMIGSGAYLDSIVIIEEKKGRGWTYRIGFDPAVHPNGVPMEVISRAQEYGSRIAVTPKMRAYLHYRGLHLKADTRFIIIPPRPHFGPTFRRLKWEVRRITKWGSQNLTKELRLRLRQARAI